MMAEILIVLDSKRPQVFLGPYPNQRAADKAAKDIREPHHFAMMPPDPMAACGDWIAHRAMLSPGFDEDIYEAVEEYGRQCDADRMTGSLFAGEF